MTLQQQGAETPAGITLVVADARDETADEFVGRFSPGRAVVVSGTSLAHQEWCIDFSDFDRSYLRIDGERYAVTDIDAIVSLTPVIKPYELLGIAEEDRAYVASELTAFLTYFGNRYAGRGINKPAIGNLLGSNWRKERWYVAARSVGFLTPEHRRKVGPDKGIFAPRPVATKSITLLGNQPLKEPENAELLAAANRLRRSAGLAYLTIRYTCGPAGYVFHEADLRPSIHDPAVAEAIIQSIYP